MPFGEETKQRFARDLGDRVPHGHVDGAYRDGALAVAARLLVLHQGAPDAVRIEVVARIVQQRCGVGFAETRCEAFPDESTLAVAAVGVESIADDGASVAHLVGDDGDQGQRHLREVDVRIRDGGCDGQGYFPDVNDTHGAQFL